MTNHTSAGDQWGGLLIRTLMICMTIAAVGAAALYLFHERLGQVAAEERSRRALSVLPDAIRPPQRDQLMIHVSTDGRSLHPRLESLGTATTARSRRVDLIVERVLALAGEETGIEVPFTPRAVFVTGGLAVVDLTRAPQPSQIDFRTECLLAYAIVNSLADNFDDIVAVQFLIDGAVTQTLAGALDISMPLVPNAALRGGEL